MVQGGEMGTAASYLRGTPGPSGFGSASTAEDVTAGLDLSSKTIIVTGKSDPKLAKQSDGFFPVVHCVLILRRCHQGARILQEPRRG